MLSKETAYGVPLIHGLVFLLLGPRDKKALMLLTGYFLLPGIPLVVRQTFVGGPSIFEALAKQITRQGAAGVYVASVLGLLFHQLNAWLIPLRTELFQYPFSASEMSLEQILLPVLGLLLVVWRLRRHRRIVAFGLGWFIVFYLPSSNLISIGTLPGGDLKAGAHHLYPAHAGLCLLLAASLLGTRGRQKNRALGAGRLRWVAFTLICLLLGVQSFRFAAHYRSADLFYQALLELHPHHTAAWTNYGWHKLKIDKDPEAAERILLGGIRAVEASRNKAARTDLMHTLMVLYLENDHPIEAETMLQCIMDSWAVTPVRSLYFWHIVRLLDRRSENPGDPQGEAPDQGG
jgi:hypothetical protein